MAAKGKKIFISYRREDASDIAGRIRDWLVQTRRIAREDIFVDVTAILPGADFMDVIEHAISQCRAVIIVISPSWLAQVNAPDTSHVRIEAEAALNKHIPVIPVLVGGAKLPDAQQLPEKLRVLLRLNVQPLRHETFDYDMGLVRRALGLGRGSMGAGASSRWVAVIAAALLVVLGLGVLTQAPPSRTNPLYALLHPAATTPAGSTTPTHTATTQPANGSLSPQDLYTQVTSGTPTLTDPMSAQDANTWDEGPSSAGTCSFRAFAYHVAVAQTDTTVECLATANGYTNFAFQTTMSIISGNAGGVIFRASQRVGPRYRWAIYTDGSYDVVLGTGQYSNTQLIKGTSPAIKQGTGQSNLLTVIAKGSTINLYINGQFVTSVPTTSSNAPFAGDLGMFAYDSSADTDVAFTDVKVWAL
jgi:hypothetical protein